MTKRIILILFYVLTINCYGQEINVGVNGGLIPLDKNLYTTIGGAFEYRPKNAIFSINTDPFLLFYQRNVLLTEPIYMKFIIGNKFRFCPVAGGFVRTTRSYGWLVGFHLEYLIKDKFILFSKNEFYKDYWKDQFYNHYGGSSTYINHSNSMLFSLGLKMMLKK